MCIAIYLPPNQNIDRETLLRSYTSNPDGCGFMYASKMRVGYVKEFASFSEFHYVFNERKKRFSGSPFVIHFRTASTSKKDVAACQPMLINDNLCFVHNGNLFEFTSYFSGEYSDTMSDTQRFNRDILRRLPANFINDARILSILEQYCQSNFSKMVFMDNEGEVTILNEAAGQWKNGVFYSNGGIEDYIGYGYSGAYYYKADEVRHGGGLINVALFEDSRWRQCHICKGYFFKLKGKVCKSCKCYQTLYKEVTRQ